MRFRTVLAVVCLMAALRTAAADERHRYLPSLALAVGVSEGHAFFHSWLGASMVQRGSTTPLFAAFGFDLDIRGAPRDLVTASAASPASPPPAPRTILSVVPSVRGGFSWYVSGSKLLPLVSVYGLVGYHPPSQYMGGAARLGWGVTFPVLLELARAGIPTMFEMTVDVGPRERRGDLRIGWSF